MAERRKQQVPPGDYLCGLGKWHPAWLQKYATTKWFIGVYGLLGTIQAMSYMYFIVTLTTLEKRFKIPSQTTGELLCLIDGGLMRHDLMYDINYQQLIVKYIHSGGIMFYKYLYK